MRILLGQPLSMNLAIHLLQKLMHLMFQWSTHFLNFVVASFVAVSKKILHHHFQMTNWSIHHPSLAVFPTCSQLKRYSLPNLIQNLFEGQHYSPMMTAVLPIHLLWTSAQVLQMIVWFDCQIHHWSRTLHFAQIPRLIVDWFDFQNHHLFSVSPMCWTQIHQRLRNLHFAEIFCCPNFLQLRETRLLSQMPSAGIFVPMGLQTCCCLQTLDLNLPKHQATQKQCLPQQIVVQMRRTNQIPQQHHLRMRCFVDLQMPTSRMAHQTMMLRQAMHHQLLLWNYCFWCCFCSCCFSFFVAPCGWLGGNVRGSSG
mmetsp:Transcript_11368/g.42655  ORF Transcript_11368/g.42655 Transcript_11368/m.42655 type:complete len:310 (+) Transcript_11368:1774-2703(+)